MARGGVNPYMKYGEIVRIPKHTPVRNSVAGQQSNRVYILIEGICSLSTFAENGNESVVLYFRPGDFVGYSPLLQGQMGIPRVSQDFLTGLSTFTKTDCKLARISGGTFMELRKQPEFNEMLMGSIFRHYTEVIKLQRIRAGKSAAAAVASFVLYHAEENENGSAVLSSFFTSAEISKSLDLHPVSTGRVVSALIKEGALSRVGRQLEVRNYSLMVDVANDEITLKY